MTVINLSTRIRKFLETYASISPNWNGVDEDGKYTGPDPYFLLTAAELIEQGEKPEYPFSDWGSGCYKPYTDKVGRTEHEDIKEEILNIIKNYHLKNNSHEK